MPHGWAFSEMLSKYSLEICPGSRAARGRSGSVGVAQGRSGLLRVKRSGTPLVFDPTWIISSMIWSKMDQVINFMINVMIKFDRLGSISWSISWSNLIEDHELDQWFDHQFAFVDKLIIKILINPPFLSQRDFPNYDVWDSRNSMVPKVTRNFSMALQFPQILEISRK